MLVSGVYFTMLEIKHPKGFEPLPQDPGAPTKKRKLEDGERDTEEPERRPASHIQDSQLVDLIPLEYVEVIYHRAPVFDDFHAWDLRLSDAFRQALCERLDDVNFQPCSLFDLRSAQYVQNDKHLVRPIEPSVFSLLMGPLRTWLGI